MRKVGKGMAKGLSLFPTQPPVSFHLAQCATQAFGEKNLEHFSLKHSVVFFKYIVNLNLAISVPACACDPGIYDTGKSRDMVKLTLARFSRARMKLERPLGGFHGKVFRKP